MAVKYHIFGRIDADTHEVLSEKVPIKYAKTYGDKRGICHADLFGYDPFGAHYTWRVVSKTVDWYEKSTDELKFRVDDHLYRVYGLENLEHKTY